METPPLPKERKGYDASVSDDVLKLAIKDLDLFSVEIDYKESILEQWLEQYRNNILFAGYINELSRRERNKFKQRPLSVKIKETKKGGETFNSDVFCLHVFNKKKRRKKIRRRIII